MLRSAGLVLSILVVSLGVIGVFFGDRLIFFPEARGDWEAARRSRHPIEEVTLKAPDGVALFSWHLRVPTPRCTVLFFHGNAGNITDRIDVLQTLGRIGADVFLLGYRGYGRSAGRPSERGFTLDAETAYRHLTETSGVPPSRLLLYGESLGGGPAIDLASKRPCAGLILQSPFTSIRDMAARVLPLFPIHWFLRSKFDNLRKIGSVAAPKLFFASRTDEVVAYEQTRRLYEASGGARRWVEFDGCGHNDLHARHEAEWAEAVSKFIDLCCGVR